MFRQTVVIRPGESGGGIERVLAGGRVFAKAGVNVSVSRGTRPAATFQQLLADHPSLADVPVPNSFDLFTASVSLVLHPVSPAVPTVHANYRYFELVLPDGTVKSWFGGGSDLTPTYVNEADAKFFHSTLRGQLARVPGGSNLYASWKPWCDRYFRLPHRGESRGIGGVFFDDWAPTQEMGREQMEKVIRTLGEGFSTTYFPIVLKRRLEPFTEVGATGTWWPQHGL
jgi:coproporphyrinogen III oxidase